MANINLEHLVHTDRPLTWRKPPTCPRCMLAFTRNTPEVLVHRMAYLLDCQHLLCGRCVLECTQEKHITCEICKHRMDIPDDRELRPSLFLLGVIEQLEYEMSKVKVYFQGSEEGSPENDYPHFSTTGKLSRIDSDVDNPTKMLSLLDKAYYTYEKSKKHLESQAKIESENVCSVVAKINAHFIDIHNALQIEENRVLQEARNAYIERYKKHKKDQHQLKMAKGRLQEYIKQAKLFPKDSEKQVKSDSGASWEQFSREVKKFLENEPMKLEGDSNKILRAPIHYRARESFLKEVQACHSLQVDVLQDYPSLVPITHTEMVHESAIASRSSSKHKEERQPRETSKHKGERKSRKSSKESSSLSHKEEKRARERSKEHSPPRRKEEPRKSSKESSSLSHKEEKRARERSKEHSPPSRKEEPRKSSKESSSLRHKEDKRARERSKERSPPRRKEEPRKSSKESSSLKHKEEKRVRERSKKHSRLKARDKGGENSTLLAASSDFVASTSASGRQNLAQSSSRRECEARISEGNWRTVYVTQVVSPREFYVQDELYFTKGASLMNGLCQEDAEAYEPVLITGGAPITITPGSMYVVQGDGVVSLTLGKRWYRAVVQAVDDPKRGQYRVQYVDYGVFDTVKRKQIRPLSAQLAARAPNATRCALYRLKPAQGACRWTDGCQQLMNDFISARCMRMLEMGMIGDVLLVDLFLPPAVIPRRARGQDDPGKQWEGRYAPMSLRAALIYVMLAEDEREFYGQDDDAQKDLLSERISQRERWLTDATAWTLQHADIPPAPVFQENDHFDCMITQAKSIEQFHIMPYTWKTTMLESLQRTLNIASRATPYVYCPYVGLVCAFTSRDKDGLAFWWRGRVLEVLRGSCLLLMLDTGELCETPWSRMRLLAPGDPALDMHPLAVRCCLGHIRPRRNYPDTGWPKVAVDEFLRIVCCPTTRFTVSMGQLGPEPANTYSVVLYRLEKSDCERCVNRLLVRKLHAECIGLLENLRDRMRELAPGEQETSMPTPTTSTGVAAVRVADPQMPVVILRVVSPGEFYVQLCEQQSAYEEMQQNLQDDIDDRIGVVEEEDDEEEEDADEGVKAGDEAVKKKRKRKAPRGMCAVFAQVGEGATPEWHRARIQTVLDDGDHYEAFLIDRAVIKQLHRTNVVRLTGDVTQIQPVAFRCRLACLSPVGGSTVWPQSSLNAFRKLIANYTQHAISLDTKPNEPNQALPVVLWGVLTPARTVYYQLNQTLAKIGMAHLSAGFRSFGSEERQLLEDAINTQLRAEMAQFFRTVAAVHAKEQAEGGSVRDGSKTAKNVLNELECMDMQVLPALDQVGCSEGVQPVLAWLPAAPLKKTIFDCVPTSVGSDGSVYLHDVAVKPLLERLQLVIQKHVAAKPYRTDEPLTAGMACLARFVFGGQFYRATVMQKLEDDRYMLRFVDYGYVVECSRSDLLPAAVCGDVPVQVIQVRLSGVIPKEEAEWKREKEKHEKQPDTSQCRWPDAALDMLETLIADKRCSIRVDPGSGHDKPPVPYCTLQLLDAEGAANLDVAKVLLELNGLFEAPSTITDADRDVKQWVEIIETKSEAERVADSIEYVDPNECEFDDKFDPLNHAQIIDVDESVEPDCNEPVAGTSRASDREFPMATVEISDSSSTSSSVTFDSEEFETSSRISKEGESSPEQLQDGRIANSLFHSFPVLPQPELLSRGFYAEFTNYASEQILYVYPHLEEHARRMNELAERVQQCANSNNELHRWQLTLPEPGAPCLARYTEDGLFYRAVVESFDEQRREVTVLYVDYLNREKVPMAELRKCSIKLQHTTLRNLPVRLVGVRTNPRLHEQDVLRRLIRLLVKPFYVKLVEQQSPASRGNASILPVELYTDADCRSLVYQQMIDESYFVPLR